MVTTNFDVLLEDAAREQGLKAAVVSPSGPYNIVADVPIWKVHGSLRKGLGSPDGASLLATASRITQPNPLLLWNLRVLLQEKHVCFVGYSGRDLDLFPMVRDFPGMQLPYWIDLSPSRDVLERVRSIGAELIVGTLDGAFQRNRLITDIWPDPLPSNITYDPQKDDQLRSEIERGLALLSADISKKAQLTQAQQQLLVAICFRRIGQPEQALARLTTDYELISRSLTSDDGALLSNTLARLYDCISDYEASERAAREALHLASWKAALVRSNKGISLRVQGLHALAMAKKMQLGPHIAYGIPAVDFSPHFRAYTPVWGRYLLTALEMKVLMLFLRTSGDSQDDVWAESAWHWYLDHKLRLPPRLRQTVKTLFAVR